MIERYTRPEMGAVWSEQRKLETWLAGGAGGVEALAEHGGRPAEDAAQIRERAVVHGRGRPEREKVTDHDVAAFVDVVAESVGEAGRWVHHGLTSSDVLDTALALQLSQAGLVLVVGRARLPRRARAPRARARGHALRGAHPRRARRAHDVRREARRASPSRPTATCTGSSARSSGVSVGALSGAVGTYSANGPGGGGGGAAAARPRARGRVDPGGAARPPRRAAVGDRARRRRPRALRHRDPPSPAHRGARGRGAVPRRARRARPRCRTSATRSSASGSPGIARLLRGYSQAGLENVALWHERDISHSSVERVALPDATILLDYAQHLAIRVVEGMVVHAGSDAREPRAHARRALLAAGAARARGVRALARRRLPDRAGERPARVRRGRPVPRAAGRAAAPGLDLDAIFDPSAFVPHADEIVARLDALIDSHGPQSPEPTRPRTVDCRLPTSAVSLEAVSEAATLAGLELVARRARSGRSTTSVTTGC